MKIDRKERFITKAKEKHEDKYDYSKVEYVDAHTKVCIICPIHGEFWITPNSHLNGSACPECGRNKKMTTEVFIEKAKQIHGDKYDYSKVEYVNSHTKVCIICPIHGEFWVSPANHLRERGCPKCRSRKNIVNSYEISKPMLIRKHTKKTFFEKAKKIHGDKYDYSKVNYKDNKTKVCIICPIHGEFWQRPDHHLHGQGCKKCGDLIRSENKKIYQEDWIKAADELHNHKYDYSKVNYKDNKTKVCIICPIHGEFWIRPDNFLNGQGCKKCGDLIRFENKKVYQEDWIKAADELHHHKYDYSKINYINANTKVCIICPEHGEFWQKPASHMQGNGCPICNESVLEREIITFLKNENIKYEYRCHPEWLGNLELDFYLPEYNVAIECQGLQHFEPIEHFGGIERFVKQIENDKLKMEKCNEQKVKLLYFSNLKKENIITNLNILKEKIYGV